MRARVGHGARAVPAVLAALDAAGISVASVTVARPSLDDVYLQYTGRAYQPGDPGGITVTAMTETARITGRHLRFFSRQPYFIGIFLVQPIIWLLLFGALFQNVINIPGFGWEGSYLDYLVPGVLVMTALFSCGWAGMSIIEDLDRSIMARFLVTPIHRSAIIAGLNLYEVISLAIQALIIGGLALLLGAQFAGGFAGLRGADAVRDARRRERGVSLRRDGADPAPARVRHRHQHLADAAADVPLVGVHAAQAGPGVDRHDRRVQPGQLGGRGRPPGTDGRSRLVLRPAAAGGLAVLAIVTTAWATFTFRRTSARSSLPIAPLTLRPVVMRSLIHAG